jgi:hypothetical protein
MESSVDRRGEGERRKERRNVLGHGRGLGRVVGVPPLKERLDLLAIGFERQVEGVGGDAQARWNREAGGE